MKFMLFHTKKDKNKIAMETSINQNILQYLVDDHKSIRYNQIIRNKFSRGDDDAIILLANRIFTNILFAENDKNKIIGYLSLLVFLEPIEVRKRNPFLDISDSLMMRIINEITSYKFITVPTEYMGKDNPLAIYAIHKCKTPAHIVQMFSKVGKYYYLPFIPETKLNSQCKQKICAGALSIFDSYWQSDVYDSEVRTYTDILLGDYSSFTMPQNKEELDLDMAISLYKYLIAKVLRFYMVYFRLQEFSQFSKEKVDDDFVQTIFGYRTEFDIANVSFDFTTIKQDRLTIFIDAITQFITENKSLAFLISNIESCLREGIMN